MNEEQYFQQMCKMRGKRDEKRFRHQMQFLYKYTDFTNARVLDIGGGAGVHSFYALAKGARQAIVIEPESDGGHNGMIDTFNSWQRDVGSDVIALHQTTIQEYAADSDPFDVIVIQDAINHFDEEACVSLTSSKESQIRYQEIFKKIANLLRPGGHAVMSDCSSKNLYPALGFSNPFDRGMEWEKHQPPGIWSKLASQQGLDPIRVRWSSPSRYGALGQTLFGSAFAAWFFTSHFVIDFRRR